MDLALHVLVALRCITHLHHGQVEVFFEVLDRCDSDKIREWFQVFQRIVHRHRSYITKKAKSNTEICDFDFFERE